MKRSTKGWVIASLILLVGGIAGGVTYLALRQNDTPSGQKPTPDQPVPNTYSIVFKDTRVYPFGDKSLKPANVNDEWIKNEIIQQKSNIFNITGTLSQDFNWTNNLTVHISNKDNKTGQVTFTAILNKANSNNDSISKTLTFENFSKDETPPLPPQPLPAEYQVAFKANSSFPFGNTAWFANNSQINQNWVKTQIINNKTQVFEIIDKSHKLDDAFFNANITISGLDKQPNNGTISFLCSLANPSNTATTPIQKTITFTNFKDPLPIVNAEVQRINTSSIQLNKKDLTEDALNTIDSNNIISLTNLTLNNSTFNYVVEGFKIDKNTHIITFKIKVILKEVNTVSVSTQPINLSYTITSTPPAVDPLEEEVKRVNALRLTLKQPTYTTTELATITNTNILDSINGFNSLAGFTYSVAPTDFHNEIPNGSNINNQVKHISFTITITSGGKSLQSNPFTLDYHIANTQLEGNRIKNELSGTLELTNPNLTTEQANNIDANNIISKLSGLNTSAFDYTVSGFTHHNDFHLYSFNLTIENKTEPKNPWTVDNIQVEYNLTTSTDELNAEKIRIENISPLELKNPEMTSAQLAQINRGNLIDKLANLDPKTIFDYNVIDFSNDSANHLLKFKIVIESGGNSATTTELSVSYTINDTLESAVVRITNYLNSYDMKFDDNKMQPGSFLNLSSSAYNKDTFILNFLNFDYHSIESEYKKIQFSVDNLKVNVIDYTCSFIIVVRNTENNEQANTKMINLTYHVPNKLLGTLDQQPAIAEVSVKNSQKGKLEKINVGIASEQLYKDRFEPINADVERKIKELVYQVRFIFYQSFSDNATSIDYGIIQQSSTSATVELKAKIRDNVTLNQAILLNQSSAIRTYSQGDIVTIRLSSNDLSSKWTPMSGGQILPLSGNGWSFAQGDKDTILSKFNDKLFPANMGNMSLSMLKGSQSIDLSGKGSFVARAFCFMCPYQKN